MYTTVFFFTSVAADGGVVTGRGQQWVVAERLRETWLRLPVAGLSLPVAVQLQSLGPDASRRREQEVAQQLHAVPAALPQSLGPERYGLQHLVPAPKQVLISSC